MDRKLKFLDARFQEIADEALQLWLPRAKLLFDPLTSGRSGAELVSVDVSGDTGELAPGTYVLRVAPTEDDLTEPNELAAHQLISAADPDFARQHIPRLLRLLPRVFPDGRLVASLHDLAGNGLARYAPPRAQSSSLLQAAHSLATGVLSSWADPRAVEPMTPGSLLREIAGEAKVSACLAASDILFTGDVYEEDGHVFANPRRILDGRQDTAIPVMRATCHADLHTGNLLLPREEVSAEGGDYWIVDIDQARHSVVGHDLAYLEVSVLVNMVRPLGRAVLARCLEAAEDPAVRSVPDDCHWLVELFKQSRAGIKEWTATQPGRMDSLHQQIMLARIAAALLWARRLPAHDEHARTCVAYAGWYALRYLRSYATSATAQERAEFEVAESTVSEAEQRAQDELWDTFWESVHGFSPSAARYILVAEHLPRSPSLAALGRVPWSVVVDLDPESDRDGLRHAAGPILDAQRAVHIVTDERPVVDFTRGTAWLLAGGSVLLNEQPLEGREWVIRRLDSVRRLVAALRQSNGDTPVCVVVLEGATDARPKSRGDRLLRVIEAMDETLGGRATFLHAGVALLEPDVPMTSLPLPVSGLLDRLAETMGTAAEYRDYTVPALDRGTAAIAPETMSKLCEHMVILHDGIELAAPAGSGQNDAFWRGGLISWADLDSGLDVVRSVNEGLVASLRESLDQHRPRTVVLEHRPGAGGTTAALRAAWDLHHEHPVAVLPNGVSVDSARVPLIAERLHLLYTIAQLPVLLVAEGGDLSEAYREALYRELHRRNTPVTILFVRRGVGDASRGSVVISDPLTKSETADFFRRYTPLARDQDRVGELSMLNTLQYARYRTPFFYGLITFEREFTKISTYVHTHLEQVRGRARDVMKFLALVTIYTNTGVQLEHIQKLMRVSSSSVGLDLADVLGPSPSRLVAVRSGRVRLQHQLLAEQVLAELFGDEHWERYLKDLSIDFIEALAEATDLSSEPIRVLLRQMFVDRQGGSVDGVEDRRKFAPLIERLDVNSAHQVLKSLTEQVPDEPHFWNHLGRHQMYRLNRELDKAEEYVARAVALAPNDFLHHHTLGLTRRSRMRAALRDAKLRGLQPVMTATDRWFAQTIECFVTTRKLNPDNIYGYITHVQAVLDVAKAIKEAARVSSVAELSSDASDWVAEHLAEANSLLSDASDLYGTLDRRDDYLVNCQADIKRLYGDLDSVVELWEVAVAGERSTSMIQRSLAQAYFARGGLSWRQLDQSELTRVVELAGQNLTKVSCKEEDYRLWFEAYKLLRDFDIDEALSQLQLWSDRFPSWRAHYYLSCLYFHLWFTSRIDDYEIFRVEQELAEKYVIGRSQRSYLWLSHGPEWFPMVADSDLGEWNRSKNFWKSTVQLQRVNGVIDFMSKPQAGKIGLAGPMTAFFVPSRGDFLVGSDENTPVNFFLGLSPEGPRAWDVQRGHLDSALYARRVVAARPTVPLVQRERIAVAPGAMVARAAEIDRQRKLEFCLALLEAWRNVGDTPLLSRLSERLQARFRYDGSDILTVLAGSKRIRLDTTQDDPLVDLDGSAGPQTFADVGAQMGRVTYVNEPERHALLELVGTAEGRARLSFEDIRAHPPGAPQPTRGQIVRIESMEMGRRGGMDARGVELRPRSDSLVDGEIVPLDRIREHVLAELRVLLEERLAADQPEVAAREIEDLLEARFLGGIPLPERLGAATFAQVWPKVDWLETFGTGAKRALKLRDGKVFGRAAQPQEPGGAREHGGAQKPPPDDRFGEALERVVGELERNSKWPPKYWRVNKALRKDLGDAYDEVVGNSLKARVNRHPGWVLDGPDLTEGVVMRAEAAATASAAKAAKAANAAKAAKPGASAATDKPAPGAAEPVPDISADVEAVLAELDQSGRDPVVTAIGNMLRTRLGPDVYAQATSKKKLNSLLKSLGYELEEPRPSAWVVRRTRATPTAEVRQEELESAAEQPTEQATEQPTEGDEDV